jgi:hypothetical protein
MSESEWIEKRIAELVAEHGAVPPPWFVFPDTHPYSICWRMGAGESHVMVFGAWWDRQKLLLDEAGRIRYFRRWPPPPRWLIWMIDVVWEVGADLVDDPDSSAYALYFARVEALGFGTRAEYQRDLDDPKWLGGDS